MTTEPSILLGKLTRREFRERMTSGQLQACIVPVAAVEQHLEHLAMEHDWRSVRHVALQVARRRQPHVLVCEALMAGVSEHHMKHPGTVSLSPATFLAVVWDLVDSMVRAGFRHILVLNGHGGNVAPSGAVWDQCLRRFQVNLHFLSYWDVLNADDSREVLESSDQRENVLPGHAQEFETSFALAAFPCNVRTDMWTDQLDPEPALATAEKGHEFIERIVERVAVYMQDMLDGRRVAEVPPFHP